MNEWNGSKWDIFKECQWLTFLQEEDAGGIGKSGVRETGRGLLKFLKSYSLPRHFHMLDPDQGCDLF